MKNEMTSLAAFVMTMTAGLSLVAENSPTPPNIVIIFCDDLGYADIGKFGAEGYQTPNLDRWRTRARFSGISTSPSRSAPPRARAC